MRGWLRRHGDYRTGVCVFLGRIVRVITMCKCWKCGAQQYITKPPAATWKARAQGFAMRGQDAANLETVAPPVPIARPLRPTVPIPTAGPLRPKSLTQARLEQALVVGACCTVGALVLWSPLPLPVKIMLPITAGTFVLSVALGKDNQDGLFRLGAAFRNFLDRDKDGDVDTDDLYDMVDELRDTVAKLLKRGAVPVHEPGPDIQLTHKDKTRPIPAPAPYIVRSLVIRVKTVDQPALVVDLDELCAFVRAAVGCKIWVRSYWTSKKRGAFKLSPDTWQAYQNFFSRLDVALWKIDPPAPGLPGLLADFRQWATDQPLTDQPTEANEAEDNDAL